MVVIFLAYIAIFLVFGFVVLASLPRKWDEQAALKRARAKRVNRARKYKPPLCVNGVYYGRLVSDQSQRANSVPRHNAQKGYW